MDGYSIQTVISSMLLHVLNIVVLFLVLRALVYRPVRKFLQARTDRIQAEQAEVAAARKEAEALHAQYEAELAHTQDVAEKQAAELLARANDAAHAITAQATADSKKTLARAKLQAQHIQEDGMRQLKRDAADIAVDIAARVLAREVSSEDNAHIIDGYFDALKKQTDAQSEETL